MAALKPTVDESADAGTAPPRPAFLVTQLRAYASGVRPVIPVSDVLRTEQKPERTTLSLMTVDTRLLSYWKVAKAFHTCEPEDERWTSHAAMPDASDTLTSQLEESRTPLRVVSHDGPARPMELRLL